MRSLLLLAAAAFLLSSCSTPGGTASDAPLPDSRDLAENPLDVTRLPQP